MVNKKATMMLLILPLIAIFMAGLASASVNWTISFPNGSIVNIATWTVNVTINSSMELDGPLNCSTVNMSLISSNTANSTVAYKVTNDSIHGAIGNQNGTWRIPVVWGIYEDGLSYTADFSCMNGSNGVNYTSDTTSITVDYGVPSGVSLTSPSDGSRYTTNNTVYFLGSADDDNMTSLNIVWRDITPTGKSIDATNCTAGNTGSNCYAQFEGVPDGDYYWTYRASDGSNTTDASSYYHVLVDYQKMTGASKAIIYEKTEQEAASKGKTNWGLIIVIVIIGIIIYQTQIKGKKKKR